MLGRKKSRLSTNIWLSVKCWWNANNNCDRPPCSLRHKPPSISEYYSQHGRPRQREEKRREEKRREENLIVRSGKSEVEVTNNRRLRSTYCTVEANYWQTQSIAQPLCDSRATCSVYENTVWMLGVHSSSPQQVMYQKFGRPDQHFGGLCWPTTVPVQTLNHWMLILVSK